MKGCDCCQCEFSTYCECCSEGFSECLDFSEKVFLSIRGKCTEVEFLKEGEVDSGEKRDGLDLVPEQIEDFEIGEVDMFDVGENGLISIVF